MRSVADRERIHGFLRAMARAADCPTRLYLVGGATAVLLGWRPSTIDVDIKLVPETDALLRAIARLKDELAINVELAAPPDFIPEVPGWEARSPAVEQLGHLAVFHYDLYAQALAKIERGHAQDVADVQTMLASGVVEGARLRELFAGIEPELYRYPAINPGTFRLALEAALGATP
jgi:hypothetical protein